MKHPLLPSRTDNREQLSYILFDPQQLLIAQLRVRLREGL
jgi:hypothetical protein